MNDNILYTNIQRFSLHDGPGIRTTVFLKGCSLHCPWCANPENLKAVPEPYRKEGRTGVYGQWISCDELFREVMKDQLFYEQVPYETGAYAGMRGGVTFSGGEPLLQIMELEPLMQRLKDNNVHLCAETALFVPVDLLLCAVQYIDLFYVDLKILDVDRCNKIQGGDLKLYYENVSLLFKKNKPIVIRIPVIGGFTDDFDNRRNIISWLKQHNPIKVELIKEHNLGSNKYLSLGKKPLLLGSVTDEMMEQYQNEIISETGLEVEVFKV